MANAPSRPDPALDALARQAAERLRLRPEAVKQAAENGRAGDLLGRLSPDEARRVQALLADETKLRQLLDSPAARALWDRLRP